MSFDTIIYLRLKIHVVWGKFIIFVLTKSKDNLELYIKK